ncbi:glutathionylspermidine synthase family protein [Xanthomonas hortorum pv. pelargonii]|nr:glutathionylspermidine synthase family protein [Xanthomonas hortorum pv. pelargonii]
MQAAARPSCTNSNYDTPTSLYESAYFQWLWLEQQIAAGVLPKGTDQYNLIQDLLCENPGRVGGGWRDRAADAILQRYAIRWRIAPRCQYLRDCAHQVGISTEEVAIEDIGLSADGWFTDEQDRVIRTLFQLYPLEFMMEERFGPALIANRVRLIEPAWKSVLSNEGILPAAVGAPSRPSNLLPARFAQAGEAPTASWVRKPLLSRGVRNISLVTAQGDAAQTDGPYVDGPARFCRRTIRCRCSTGGMRWWAVGWWPIAPPRLGMRDDDGPITRDTSRFVPHVIVD